MHKIILPSLTLLFIALLSACAPGLAGPPAGTPLPPTASDLAGKWKSEYAFYIVFDEENGTFSGSNDAQAAENMLGILGTFSLHGNQLSLVENEDSESCPGVEGQFEAVLTSDDKLRLTIIEDSCLYRVEGLFQGGQGGHRLLEFRRVKD